MLTSVPNTSGPAHLYYEVHGDDAAPPVLMIRGLARTARHWGDVVPELARSFRVIVFDNRGVGRSSAPPPPYTTRMMADDAARVLDAAGVPRAHVFGVSLGGMIAQELALGHPARVDRLVLGCTRAGGLRHSTMMPLSVIAGLVGPMRLGPEEAVRRTAPLVLSERFIRDRPDVIEHWVQLVRDEPPKTHGVLAQLAAGALHAAGRRLGHIRRPTLVVTGDADRLIDAENSRRLARLIPGARLSLIPGAGHDFPTEVPQQLAELLADFLLGDALTGSEAQLAPTKREINGPLPCTAQRC